MSFSSSGPRGRDRDGDKWPECDFCRMKREGKRIGRGVVRRKLREWVSESLGVIQARRQRKKIERVIVVA